MIKPKIPTFNNKPANNILPTVGASTWTLGNQKCNINKGLLTKNKPTQKNKKILETYIKNGQKFILTITYMKGNEKPLV